MSTARKFWRIGWRIAVCCLLLVWVFHRIFLNEGQRAWQRQGKTWETLSHSDQWRVAWSHGPQELWNTLHLVDPTAFAVSLLFMGSTVLLGAVRWRRILRVQGLDLSVRRTLGISLVAQFFNAFLLGSTGGDLLKAYYAARETHHRKTEAVVTVLVDRLIGLFSMLALACLLMIPNYRFIIDYSSYTALALLVFSMMLVCGGFVALAFWGGVSRRWPGARDWLRRLPKGETLERSLEACRRFGHARGFLSSTLALSTALNLACVLQLTALAWGLHLKIPLLVFPWVVLMIICASALPITPSGLGVREHLYVLLLAVPAIHVDATKALALSLLAYAGFLLWSLVGGVVYLFWRESQHLSEVTGPNAAAEENPTA